MEELEEIAEVDFISKIFNITFLPHQSLIETTPNQRYFLRSSVKTATPIEILQTKNSEIPIVEADKNISEESEKDIAFRFGEVSISVENMIKHQQADNFCLNLINKIKMNKKKILKKKFEIINGLLFNLTINGSPRLVIPNIFSAEFASFINCISMHPGALALQRIIQKSVYIHEIQRICQQVAHECETCIQTKSRKTLKPSKVPNRSFSNHPWSRVYTDLMDMGTHKDKNGFRYLLTFVDELSGYIDGICLRNKLETNVVKALTTLATRWGAFNEIVSDRGTEYSNLYNKVMKNLGLRPIRTAAYQSTGNYSERMHREVNQKIRIMGKGTSNWSDLIPYIMFHINNMPKERNNGLLACEVIFGRPLHIPFRTIEEMPENKGDWITAFQNYLKELHPSLVKFQMDRYQKLLDRDKNTAPTLRIGERVLIFKPGIKATKHYTLWNGPLTVIKQIAKDTYQIRDPITKRVFVRNIKRIRKLVPNRPDHIYMEPQEEEIEIQNESDHIPSFEFPYHDPNPTLN